YRRVSGSRTSSRTAGMWRPESGTSSVIVAMLPEDPADEAEHDQRHDDREQQDDARRVHVDSSLWTSPFSAPGSWAAAWRGTSSLRGTGSRSGTARAPRRR